MVAAVPAWVGLSARRAGSIRGDGILGDEDADSILLDDISPNKYPRLAFSMASLSRSLFSISKKL